MIHPKEDWLRPLRQSTERIRKESEGIRQETENLRQQNAALEKINHEKLKQIVEASIIKPTTMTTPSDPYIQTGRTTRMLTEAFKLAKEGKAVYVIAANHGHIFQMERMADRLFGAGEASALGVKFETSASLPSFDFRTMQLKGAHPNCCVFVDHWAIESEYARMLNELHRFDVALPEPTLFREETTGPDPALLESMALRYRHDFGLLDSKHQAAILVTMRQLWEEVAGVGFYRPHN